MGLNGESACTLLIHRVDSALVDLTILWKLNPQMKMCVFTRQTGPPSGHLVPFKTLGYRYGDGRNTVTEEIWVLGLSRSE